MLLYDFYVIWIKRLKWIPVWFMTEFQLSLKARPNKGITRKCQNENNSETNLEYGVVVIYMHIYIDLLAIIKQML